MLFCSINSVSSGFTLKIRKRNSAFDYIYVHSASFGTQHMASKVLEYNA